MESISKLILNKVQKQPLRGVPRKRCSENMQQIYRRTPMPKCDFNKVLKYWALLSIWQKKKKYLPGIS